MSDATYEPGRDRQARIGDDVFFVLGGNTARPGEVRPAKVVNAFYDNMVNLVVFVDGLNDFPDQPEKTTLWETSVYYDSHGHTLGTWHSRQDNIERNNYFEPPD